MFRALLRPSSEHRDYNVDYHIGRLVLGLLWFGLQAKTQQESCVSLQPGHYSSLTAPNLQNQQTKNETTNVVINNIVASSWWWA